MFVVHFGENGSGRGNGKISDWEEPASVSTTKDEGWEQTYRREPRHSTTTSSSESDSLSMSSPIKFFDSSSLRVTSGKVRSKEDRADCQSTSTVSIMTIL